MMSTPVCASVRPRQNAAWSILIEACRQEEPRTVTAEELQAWVDQLYGGNKPTNVVDQLIQERRAEAARE
jgi:hypothetical protein